MSHLLPKPGNVLHISFKTWYLMLLHFPGLSFSNTKNCLDSIREEECIWIIIRTKNEKKVEFSTPRHLYRFKIIICVLSAIPHSFCRWQWSPGCLHREEIAVTLPGFCLLFFGLDRFEIVIHVCLKSRCPQLYNTKCRWEISIFFDVASSVQHVFVLMVVDTESALIWDVAKHHVLCSYKWDRDSSLISSASYSCFLESRHSEAHMGPDSDSAELQCCECE